MLNPLVLIKIRKEFVLSSLWTPFVILEEDPESGIKTEVAGSIERIIEIMFIKRLLEQRE